MIINLLLYILEKLNTMNTIVFSIAIKMQIHMLTLIVLMISRGYSLYRLPYFVRLKLCQLASGLGSGITRMQTSDHKNNRCSSGLYCIYYATFQSP